MSCVNHYNAQRKYTEIWFLNWKVKRLKKQDSWINFFLFGSYMQISFTGNKCLVTRPFKTWQEYGQWLLTVIIDWFQKMKIKVRPLVDKKEIR